MDLHSHIVSDWATASPPAAKADRDVFFGSIGREEVPRGAAQAGPRG